MFTIYDGTNIIYANMTNSTVVPSPLLPQLLLLDAKENGHGDCVVKKNIFVVKKNIFGINFV